MDTKSEWEEVKDRAQMFIKRDDDTIALQTTATIAYISDLIIVGDTILRAYLTQCREVERLSEKNFALVSEQDSLKHAFELINKINGDNFQIIEEQKQEIEASKKLCEIYFNIAAEAIGEEQVRSIRDEALKDKQ